MPYIKLSTIKIKSLRLSFQAVRKFCERRIILSAWLLFLVIVIQKATKESMVRIMGFDPIRQMATDFESASSTDSNISAYQAVLKVV